MKRRWHCAALLAACVAALDAAAVDETCAPWPSEPRPLPQVFDPDPARARWAELRAKELAAYARRLAPRDSVEAHRVWRRVLCLDPQNRLALRGLPLTRSVSIHRPGVRWIRNPAPVEGDAWASLDAPVHVAIPAGAATASPQRGPTRDQTRARRLLDQGEELLAEAHFEEALRQADTARELLAGERGSGPDLLRVRSAVIEATAHVALGNAEAARASFARALEIDPGLSLDPERTSPKVLEALEAARLEPADES